MSTAIIKPPKPMKQLILAIAICFGCLPSTAQELFIEGDNLVQLEVLKPVWIPDTGVNDEDDFDTGNEVTSFSSVSILAGQYEIRPDLFIEADLPFSQVRFVDNAGADGYSFGNPYIGAGMRHDSFVFRGGIRLPIAETKFNPMVFGIAADIDHVGRYVPQSLPVTLSALYAPQNNRGWGMNLGLEATYIPIFADDPNADSDWLTGSFGLGRLRSQWFYDSGKIKATATLGVLGAFYSASEDLAWGPMLGASLMGRFGSWRPAVTFHMPTAVPGVRLGYQF